MRFGLALTAVLLLAVAVPHYAYELLGSMWPDPVRAARAWFYVLRGFSGAILFATVAVLAGMLAGATQRWRWFVPVALVCAWGFTEEAETGICRLGLGIGAAPPDVHWRGLCDALTGLPLYWLGLVTLSLLGVLVAAIGGEKKWLT